MHFRCFLFLLSVMSPPLGAQGRGSQPRGGVVPVATGYTVDFDNQDIRVVLSALAEAAGQNVTFSNLPQRPVTLHLGQPVAKEGIPALIRSVAESNNLQLTEDGSLLRIESKERDSGRQQFGTGQRQEALRLYTYRLKHASAAQVAPVLMNLFSGVSVNRGGGGGRQNGRSQGGGSTQGGGVSFNFSLGVVQGTQQLGTGSVQSGGGGFQIGGGGAQPDGGGGTRQYSTSNGGQVVVTTDGDAPPGLLNQLLQGFGVQTSDDDETDPGVSAAPGAPASPGALSSSSANVRIVAEESSNSLLVRATPQDWQIIQHVVQSIDLRPLQVLIEVSIVEVTRTHDLSLGISGDATRTTGKRSHPDVTASYPSAADARDFILKLTGGSGVIDFNVALNALATRGETRILSLPIIIAQNNKEAKLNVGSSRPFVQVSQTVPLDPSSRVQTVQYIDVGTTLTITPIINEDGYVNMTVTQTANSATTEIQFDAPVINKREATTQVFVRNGQTAVIGGLADKSHDHTRSGIPILSSIPFIGRLFSNTRETDVTSELFVFLTPHVVSGDADIDRLRNAVEDGSVLLKQSPVHPLVPPSPTDTLPLPVPHLPGDTLTLPRVRARRDTVRLIPPSPPFPVVGEGVRWCVHQFLNS